MSKEVKWMSESLWKKIAIWVTSLMLLILVALTFDTVSQITEGTSRVPDYSVINNKIFYEYDKKRDILAPVIGESSPLFGKELDESEAEKLVNLGKLSIQAKNCMNCHTILGNGAYYAPDLTKAWLDKGWGSESVRETLMLSFLLDPETNARSFGTNRKMPNIGISEEEARGVIAYLKWMSSIDTNGFPAHFESIVQDKESK